MTQTLTNSILAVKARAQKEEQAKPVAGAKPTFWDKEREREAKDVENKVLQNAVALGKLRANAFFASLHDRKAKDHEQILAAWKGTYAMDSKKVEDDIVQKTCQELGARKFEKNDPTYENMVYSKWKPLDANVTRESLAAWNNFKSALREKWDARGTAGDASFIKQVAEKYSLSPNDHLYDFKIFQPKD